MNIVITDCEYRMAVSLVQSLGQAGHYLILCHTKDMPGVPPAFASRYAGECHEIDAFVKEPAYIDALEKICGALAEPPVLLPVGAKTTALIAECRERFDGFCRTLLPTKEILDQANDKDYVRRTAMEIGVPTPPTFGAEPKEFPVIVKPACGEKFGLKAAERYARADNREQFEKVYARMKQYDDAPLVQKYIEGEGVGVCAVMTAEGAAAVLCHRRLREYPVSGGPSTCCESFYDEVLAEQAVRLLKALHFVGIAMVEFKGTKQGGYYLLEINPRVWGSFPMTRACGSRFADVWARAAAGETFETTDCAYKRGQKMRFLFNDTAAMLALLKQGKLRLALHALRDMLCVKEALYDRTDKAPFYQYIKNTIRRK